MRRIAIMTALMASMGAPVGHGARAASQYRLVEHWAQCPSAVMQWAAATGVDVDSRDNVYVFHRNEAMPIMAFDRRGKFLRAWGQGLFKTTHFLRVDRFG